MHGTIAGYDWEKTWEYENGFYLTSKQDRIAKALAQYELYKDILNLPGEVVECGVFKGASLIRWLTYRNMLETQCARTVIGFDAFGKFPMVEDDCDNDFIEKFEHDAGQGIEKSDMDLILAKKGFDNYRLVAGNILETIPAYKDAHPELRIALLHVDVDVYEPTAFVLSELWPFVVTGGLVVFDDYGKVPGATVAIDEFFAEMADTENAPLVALEKARMAYAPAFVRKP